MKTPSVQLAALTVFLLIAILLFVPMRSGDEDHIEVSVNVLRMDAGDEYDIDYTLYAYEPQKVVYSSSNKNVATIDSFGVVTAHAPGKARIRVIAEGGARTGVDVEVAGVGEQTITLNTNIITLEKGQISGLQARFAEDAEDTRVVWTSENKAVATVDSIGRVSAVGGGETRITATAMNGASASAFVKVFVRGDAVLVTPADITVGVGARLQMDSYYLPEDTTDEVLRWESSNEAVLTVKEDGMIQAKSVGQAVLSVFTKNGLRGSTLIRVEPSASDFELAPTAVARNTLLGRLRRMFRK